MKTKYDIGQKVIVVDSGTNLTAREMVIGGIKIDEDGIFYAEGSYMVPGHIYHEDYVFTTQKQAQEMLMALINQRTNEFKTKLIEGVAK